MEVRKLSADDAAEFKILRLRALREHPEAFGASDEEEGEFSLETVASRLEQNQPDQTYFAAFIEGTMVGTGRFSRVAGIKRRHRAMISAIYALPEVRGQGVARAITTHILEFARTQAGVEDLHLSVTSGNRSARTLYRNLGFVTWGVCPRYIYHQGQYYDIEWMVLHLRQSG